MQRNALFDNLKGLACLFIMAHHLAVYGPMSDVAYALIPQSTDWFYEYGRMAVSVFLALGGFLTGLRISTANAFVKKSVTEFIWHKYKRLIIPYLAAIGLAILCSWLASQWMTHESISGSPTVLQLISHALLLQNLLGYDSLSAGLWYVAIDFQLFVVSVLIVFLVERIAPASWSYNKTQAIEVFFLALLSITSLFVFNLRSHLDNTFLYFYGTYGLGVLAAFACNSRHTSFALFLIGDITILALMMDFRERILIAFIIALLLATATRNQWQNSKIWQNPMAYLGSISYSVFLVHFPVSLLVNSALARFYPDHMVFNLVGMLASMALSIGVAIPFHRVFEKQ